MKKSTNFLEADTTILDTKLRIVHVSFSYQHKFLQNSDEIFNQEHTKCVDSVPISIRTQNELEDNLNELLNNATNEEDTDKSRPYKIIKPEPGK